MLEIKNEVLNGDMLVIHLTGRLDSLTSKLFVEKTTVQEYSSCARIILNCKNLNYISSEGLRVILMAAKKAKSLGGALTLCEMNPIVKEVMIISGFGELLGIHADLNQAVEFISQLDNSPR